MQHNHWEGFYTHWLVVITLLAAALRFWGLGDVPAAYFDEINIPHFGYALLNDLQQTPFVTAHPPLPHYLFAAAIEIYYWLPWVDGAVTDPWGVIDPLSYRWLSALTGTLCCVLLAAIVKSLGGGAGWALLAALFVAIDGALIVDSRAALNNILMLFFGLAAVWAFSCALARGYAWRPLVLCGLLMGATVSVKWNGLGFWLVALAVLLGVAVFQARGALQMATGLAPINGARAWRLVLCLLVLPAATYWLLWQPYLAHEQHWGFIEMHQRISRFHTEEVGAASHPYCSAWYQWPYQGRPMSYLFERVPLGGGEGFRAIHLLGNPLLYLLSALAALWLVMVCGRDFLVACFSKASALATRPLLWVIVAGFLGNWLPWLLVSRCLFSYHYEPASVFAFAALAGLLAQAGRARGRAPRAVWGQASAVAAVLTVLAIVAVAVYFMPLALGLPVSREGFYSRMWFSFWI
ncbi:phospholipid carrier-dependent glycosyltransferase [Simiduia sp. 21SJ11W-1]|uniref:phospholipid carrier-dependent glycosyltransferase n=1 Tax=Simiduia sp. 21SJ11W-1 TaxID=2909669 RepID=UPI00209CBAD9|nr:phospholipid carrier-dependent glycosyltransferase [Simiduia sp. 21SJ11W-1]UTA49138.1 phospholipid carrier-dependent glycosyltransferase [Simiduia sp. 21SJ11W-1]